MIGHVAKIFFSGGDFLTLYLNEFLGIIFWVMSNIISLPRIPKIAVWPHHRPVCRYVFSLYQHEGDPLAWNTFDYEFWFLSNRRI